MATASSANFFSIFGLEPRPALDEEGLKQKFLALSADHHPDKFHGDAAAREAAEARYSEINQAYQRLRDPKERLLYLYELEKGSKPRDVQRIPPGTMDLFVEVGQKCQAIDAFLNQRQAAQNPLEKANLMMQGLDLVDQVQALRQKIEQMRLGLNDEVLALDREWAEGKKDLDRLEAVYRKYSYVSRWTQQLEEREVALTLF